MSTKNMVTGVLIGAAAGAALGILFAPAKGSKTRRKLMRKKDSYTSSLQEKVDQFVEELTEQYENTKDQLGLTKQGKEKSNHVKKEEVKHSLS